MQSDSVFLDDVTWAPVPVAAGSLLYAFHPRVPGQRVQWFASGERHLVEGYVN